MQHFPRIFRCRSFRVVTHPPRQNFTTVSNHTFQSISRFGFGNMYLSTCWISVYNWSGSQLGIPNRILPLPRGCHSMLVAIIFHQTFLRGPSVDITESRSPASGDIRFCFQLRAPASGRCKVLFILRPSSISELVPSWDSTFLVPSCFFMIGQICSRESIENVTGYPTRLGLTPREHDS